MSLKRPAHLEPVEREVGERGEPAPRARALVSLVWGILPRNPRRDRRRNVAIGLRLLTPSAPRFTFRVFLRQHKEKNPERHEDKENVYLLLHGRVQ